MNETITYLPYLVAMAATFFIIMSGVLYATDKEKLDNWTTTIDSLGGMLQLTGVVAIVGYILMYNIEAMFETPLAVNVIQMFAILVFMLLGRQAYSSHNKVLEIRAMKEEQARIAAAQAAARKQALAEAQAKLDLYLAANPDIDGDGIPNIDDDDIDGDGILNADDNTIYGTDAPTVPSFFFGFKI